MTTLGGIFGALLLAACLGLSMYLFTRDRIPGRTNRSAGRWVILAGRLCLLAVATFAILVQNSARIFALGLAFHLASVLIEVARRRRASNDAK